MHRMRVSENSQCSLPQQELNWAATPTRKPRLGSCSSLGAFQCCLDPFTFPNLACHQFCELATSTGVDFCCLFPKNPSRYTFQRFLLMFTCPANSLPATNYKPTHLTVMPRTFTETIDFKWRSKITLGLSRKVPSNYPFFLIDTDS